jgi:MoxR-like ATPase
VERVADTREVLEAQRDVRQVFVSEPLQGYMYQLVARTRSSGDLALGASPRATLALLAATQAAAAIEGRAFATPDDVKSVAPLVLAHRLIVRAESEIEGATASGILERILAATDVPANAGAPAR